MDNFIYRKLRQTKCSSTNNGIRDNEWNPYEKLSVFPNENLKQMFNNLVKTIPMTWFHIDIPIISGVWTSFCTKTDWCNQPWHINQKGDTTPTIRRNNFNLDGKLLHNKTYHVQLRSWYLKIFGFVRMVINLKFFIHLFLVLDNVVCTIYYINF